MGEQTIQPTVTRVECGIDWLTLTLPLEAAQYTEWRTTCIERLGLWHDAGNFLRSTKRLGYDGIGCGGSFVGERYDGSIAIYTGALAGRVFNDVYHESAHCSRLDAQVTMQLSEDDPVFGQRRHTEADIANQRLPESRRRKLPFAGEINGGKTYYIGARSSPCFGRIYDKMRESKDQHFDNCWRYEVEAHNSEATTLFKYLHVVDVPLPAVIKAYVARWFVRRGVSCPFWLDGCPDPMWATIRDKPDNERRLEWLRHQVRPAIRTLRQAADDSTIAEALGIDLALIPWLVEAERTPDDG